MSKVRRSVNTKINSRKLKTIRKTHLKFNRISKQKRNLGKLYLNLLF